METNRGKADIARFAVLFVLASGAVTSMGCAAAAVGAGAGAATAAYFTSRGAGSIVNGSVSDVASRTQVAMSQMDIPVTGTKSEKSGDHREFKGAKEDLDVTVTLDKNSNKTTKVEVDARRNLVTWDKDLAKSLLDRIVASND